MNLQKALTVGIALVGFIGFAFWVMIVRGNDGEANEGAISMMMYLSYILGLIATAVAVVFSLKNIVSHSDKLKRAGISVVGLLVVLVIAYVLSTGNEVVSNTGEIIASESASKWVGTGLRVFYILSLIAVGAVVASGVKKALNK